MKVYVISVKDAGKDRLEQFKNVYPNCLPEYSVWEAKTPKTSTMPEWWQSSAEKWALVETHLDIWRQANDDVLIFEDDCTFRDDFETRYTTFMSEVPNDWDMLYLGAYHLSPPVQLSDNVLKLRNSVCGHAFICRKEALQRLIDWYEAGVWSCLHAPDVRRAYGMATDRFKAYSPIVNICGQSEGYSLLDKHVRHARNYNSFKYVKLDGFIGSMVNGNLAKHISDTVGTIDKFKDDSVASVSVFGNPMFAVSFVLKQKELKDVLKFPIVCHTTNEYKDLIQRIADQEDIDISDITFILHEYKGQKSAELWRYEPIGSKYLHCFDVDNHLVPFHVEAINDFLNQDTFKVYSARYYGGAKAEQYKVLGGGTGMTNDLANELFKVWNTTYFDDKRLDEKFMTAFFARNNIQRINYVPKSMHDTDHVKFKVLKSPAYLGSFFIEEFKEMKGFSDGMYKLGDEFLNLHKAYKY